MIPRVGDKKGSHSEYHERDSEGKRESPADWWHCKVETLNAIELHTEKLSLHHICFETTVKVACSTTEEQEDSFQNLIL